MSSGYSDGERETWSIGRHADLPVMSSGYSDSEKHRVSPVTLLLLLMCMCSLLRELEELSGGCCGSGLTLSKTQ